MVSAPQRSSAHSTEMVALAQIISRTAWTVRDGAAIFSMRAGYAGRDAVPRAVGLPLLKLSTRYGG